MSEKLTAFIKKETANSSQSIPQEGSIKFLCKYMNIIFISLTLCYIRKITMHTDCSESIRCHIFFHNFAQDASICL